MNNSQSICICMVGLIGLTLVGCGGDTSNQGAGNETTTPAPVPPVTPAPPPTAPQPNSPPQVTSTPPSQVLVNTAFSYVVSATDADGDQVAFSWVSNQPAWLTLVDNGDGTAQMTGTVPNSPQTYNLALQADDGQATTEHAFTLSAIAPTTLSVSITEPANPFTAATYTPTVTITDEAVESVRKAWDLLPASTTAKYLHTTTGNVDHFSFPLNGHYHLQLTVTDVDGNTATDTVELHIAVPHAETIAGKIMEDDVGVGNLTGDIYWLRLGAPESTAAHIGQFTTELGTGAFTIGPLLGDHADYQIRLPAQ